MIVDYSEYITEKASKGIVNSVYVENGLPLFKHDSICPFCKQNLLVPHLGQTGYGVKEPSARCSNSKSGVVEGIALRNKVIK